MIFLGCLFERERENEYLKKSKCGISNAVNGYQWNLIDGLNKNLAKPVSIINALPVGIWKKQYSDLILKDRQWQYAGADNVEIGCVNLPLLKQHGRYRRCLKLLRKSEDKNILIYSPYLPFLKAISKLDKSYTVTLVVTDLPEFYDLGQVSALRKILRKLNNRSIYKCMARVDNFVLLTEEMKEPLRVGDRPYTVVEGICDPTLFDDIAAPETKANEKIILYTGTLHKKFGIGNLLDAFRGISDPDYRLWICGGGDMKDEIVKAAETDSRIRFFGYVPKKTICEMQKQATVLVNPRPNNEAYTKYSFPSKTMEYMLSGKPVIMYKLDGIPHDYDNYLRYVPDDSVSSLRETIVSVCDLSEESRSHIGENARKFLIQNKNNRVQAKRILEMIP